MPRVDWSTPAVLDLNRIDDWLIENRSAEFALQTVRSIRKRADWLGNFPHGGRPSPDGLRILRVFGTRYLIVYQISPDCIEVVRVHHEREDWQTAV